jgi:hypothetical protein
MPSPVDNSINITVQTTPVQPDNVEEAAGSGNTAASNAVSNKTGRGIY